MKMICTSVLLGMLSSFIKYAGPSMMRRAMIVAEKLSVHYRDARKVLEYIENYKDTQGGDVYSVSHETVQEFFLEIYESALKSLGYMKARSIMSDVVESTVDNSIGECVKEILPPIRVKKGDDLVSAVSEIIRMIVNDPLLPAPYERIAECSTSINLDREGNVTIKEDLCDTEDDFCAWLLANIVNNYAQLYREFWGEHFCTERMKALLGAFDDEKNEQVSMLKKYIMGGLDEVHISWFSNDLNAVLGPVRCGEVIGVILEDTSHIPKLLEGAINTYARLCRKCAVVCLSPTTLEIARKSPCTVIDWYTYREEDISGVKVHESIIKVGADPVNISIAAELAVRDFGVEVLIFEDCKTLYERYANNWQHIMQNAVAYLSKRKCTTVALSAGKSPVNSMVIELSDHALNINADWSVRIVKPTKYQGIEFSMHTDNMLEVRVNRLENYSGAKQTPIIQNILCLYKLAMLKGKRSPRLYYEIGRIYYSMGYEELAQKYYVLARVGEKFEWYGGGDFPFAAFIEKSIENERWEHIIWMCRHLIENKFFVNEWDEKKLKNLLATTYVRMGDYSLAQEVYREILNKYGEEPKILYALGYLNMKMKRYDNAERLLSRCLEIAPDYAPAKRALMSMREENK